MRSTLAVAILVTTAGSLQAQQRRSITDEPTPAKTIKLAKAPRLVRSSSRRVKQAVHQSPFTAQRRAVKSIRSATNHSLVKQKPIRKSHPKPEPVVVYSRGYPTRNNWFGEFRMFSPKWHGPFRYTHPLLPRWTRVPKRSKWLWIASPEDFRAEHARFGNGFESREMSHNWHSNRR